MAVKDKNEKRKEMFKNRLKMRNKPKPNLIETPVPEPLNPL